MAEAQPQSVVECTICYNAYDGNHHKPAVGACGHNVCLSCFYGIQGKCPMCNRQGMFHILVFNYVLLEQIELTNENLARIRAEIGEREQEIDILKVEILVKSENLQEVLEENRRLTLQREGGPCNCGGKGNNTRNNELETLRNQLAAANQDLTAAQASLWSQYEMFNSNHQDFYKNNIELEKTKNEQAEELRNLKENMAGHEEQWRREYETTHAEQLQALKDELEKQKTEEMEKERVNKVQMNRLKVALEVTNRQLEQETNQAKTANAFLEKRTEERENYRKEKDEMRKKLEEVTWKLERTVSELKNCKKRRDRLEEEVERVSAELERMKTERRPTECISPSPGFPIYRIQPLNENVGDESFGNKRKVAPLRLQLQNVKKRKESNREASEDNVITVDACKSSANEEVSRMKDDVILLV